jgi:hypothetical protein
MTKGALCRFFSFKAHPPILSGPRSPSFAPLRHLRLPSSFLLQEEKDELPPKLLKRDRAKVVAYIVKTHHNLKKQAREKEAEVSGLPILAALWLPWPFLEGVAKALVDEGKGLLRVRVCD